MLWPFSSTLKVSMSAHRVGWYLAVIQFFFALSWTVYVIFLPQLAAQVGIPRSAVIWVLMLDQIIFVLADYAMGVASDRAVRVVGRLGRVVLAVTLLSCAAFLALPLVAPSGSAPLFLGIVVLWSVTSSALRAPPLTLVGRHAAKPQVPWLVGLSMLGLGVASAIAPYLSVVLRDLDPRGPFLLSSIALALATWGILAAERALAGQPAAPASSKAPERHAPPVTPVAIGFLMAAALAAAAFQLHTFINSTPLYLRFAKPAELQWLAPVFWIGFNLAMLPASWASKRFGGWQVMGVAGLTAALASLWAHQASSLQPLIAAQLMAGAAWAGLLMSAFSVALALGHTGREGRFGGALSSVLALAALGRMAVLAAEWQKDPGAQPALAWAPVVGWLLAGSVLFLLSRRRQV
ncbi:MAG: MFS transporter [Rhizobacter sp.]|nr:MFS transporter [Rhizobacter sp.]